MYIRLKRTKSILTFSVTVSCYILTSIYGMFKFLKTPVIVPRRDVKLLSHVNVSIFFRREYNPKTNHISSTALQCLSFDMTMCCVKFLDVLLRKHSCMILLYGMNMCNLDFISIVRVNTYVHRIRLQNLFKYRL